jgi:FkbM family methyltransferase
MIANRFRSALRAVSSRSSREAEELTFSVDDVVDQVYRGLFDREPDPAGRKAFRNLLSDGLHAGRPGVAEMLRACIESPEFRLRYSAESTAPIGITASDAQRVFACFRRYEGPGRPGHVANFLGAFTRTAFSSGIGMLDGQVEDYPLSGNFHGGAMEWVGTLRAVLDATDGFRMLELGAGFGPWCVVGYLAAAQRGIPEIMVVGVEGDAGHVEFMEKNFATNGLPPGACAIVRGVVAVADGVARFPKAKDPSQVYGAGPPLAASGSERDPFDFFMQGNAHMVQEVVEVPAFSLASLTARYQSVDLVHCDVQGGELELFRNGIDLASEKVKRVVIGTHSPEIDRGLIGVFATNGWVLEGAEDCFIRHGLFHDGTQVWRNPYLSG